MASKEAKDTKQAEPEFFAFEFTLDKEKIGEKTTNPQVKSKVGEAFMGYGAFTETQVQGQPGENRTVIIFFARLFGKGQPAYESLKKNEKVTVKIYDEDVEIRLSGASPSGGGATTGTSGRPKKAAAPKAGGRGGKPKDGEAKPKEGEKKEDRPKRAAKKPEEKKESSARGRANIGGKLGPVSKIRLAKQQRDKWVKENEARAAAGLEPLPDPFKKKKEDDDDSGLPPKKEAGKKDAGKKEAGKAAPKAGKAEAKKGK
jgi:hypothetical protein